MKRTVLKLKDLRFPKRLESFLGGAEVYDSSCSDAAQVFFINKGKGFFLKKGAPHSLKAEAELTSYFSRKGLAATVVDYFSDEFDWMITEAVKGEDCTHTDFLTEPARLACLLGETLRALHKTDHSDCPVQNRTESYVAFAKQNYETGRFDSSHFPDSFGFASAEDAWRTASEGQSLLKNDVLIHGDFCLPNIILDKFCFSGFIDLGNGGVGDRHIDLFWGLWSLWFNLKTDKFGDVFLDAYGRDEVDKDVLKIISAFEVFG